MASLLLSIHTHTHAHTQVYMVKSLWASIMKIHKCCYLMINSPPPPHTNTLSWCCHMKVSFLRAWQREFLLFCIYRFSSILMKLILLGTVFKISHLERLETAVTCQRKINSFTEFYHVQVN